jgi:hypothetical protein
MLPRVLLGADDDWQEPLRRTLYPRLHDPLVWVGNLIGTPMYAQGVARWDQYVGTLPLEEDAIEAELEELASVRNPIAALKELPDGRISEGSWVLLHEDAPDLVDEGMQLHLTLFARESDATGRVVYAHYEDDWRTNWRAHLKETNFSTAKGVTKARRLFARSSLLTLKDKTNKR